MGHLDMVGLHEVFHEELPVRLAHLVGAEQARIFRHPVVPGLFGGKGKTLRERGRVFVERHVDPAFPDLRADRGQAVIRLIKFHSTLHPGRAGKPAVEVVAPAVERADQLRRISFPVRDEARAMPAHVREAPDRAFRVACGHDGLARDLAGDVIAELRHFVGPAQADPVFPEDPFDFPFGQFLGNIGSGRKRNRALERTIRHRAHRRRQRVERSVRGRSVTIPGATQYGGPFAS